MLHSDIVNPPQVYLKCVSMTLHTVTFDFNLCTCRLHQLMKAIKTVPQLSEMKPQLLFFLKPKVIDCAYFKH